MTITAGMLAHLQSNVTFLCEVWRITARDGTVAAYAAHTRNLLYDGVTYKAAPVEPTRTSKKIGLESDTAELFGVFDDIITEADVYGGRWHDARIRKEIVCYLDLALGSVAVCSGFAGSFSINNGTFTVEFRALSDRLSQSIGSLASPTDRTRRADETGVSMAPYTHATSVTAASSRRVFKVSYVQPGADYFKYGLALFTSGPNSGQEMEVKASTTTDSGTRTQVELQLPMRSDIGVGNAVTLKRGYSGTREDAKALGSVAVLNFDGEPDMPLSTDILRYEP